MSVLFHVFVFVFLNFPRIIILWAVLPVEWIINQWVTSVQSFGFWFNFVSLLVLFFLCAFEHSVATSTFANFLWGIHCALQNEHSDIHRLKGQFSRAWCVKVRQGQKWATNAFWMWDAKEGSALYVRNTPCRTASKGNDIKGIIEHQRERGERE